MTLLCLDKKRPFCVFGFPSRLTRVCFPNRLKELPSAVTRVSCSWIIKELHHSHFFTRISTSSNVVIPGRSLRCSQWSHVTFHHGATYRRRDDQVTRWRQEGKIICNHTKDLTDLFGSRFNWIDLYSSKALCSPLLPNRFTQFHKLDLKFPVSGFDLNVLTFSSKKDMKGIECKKLLRSWRHHQDVLGQKPDPHIAVRRDPSRGGKAGYKIKSAWWGVHDEEWEMTTR